ncbi:MAG: hypothetical protein HQL34_01655, partial [Alphaproteobacteria bacterium]|nr:hypothetical protein [Alphaproteobacteria bacterium]
GSPPSAAAVVVGAVKTIIKTVAAGSRTPVAKSAPVESDGGASRALAVRQDGSPSAATGAPPPSKPGPKPEMVLPATYFSDDEILTDFPDGEDMDESGRSDDAVPPAPPKDDFDDIIDRTRDSLNQSIATLMERQRGSTEVVDPTIESRRRDMLAEMEASIIEQKNTILNRIMAWAEAERQRLEEWTDKEYRAEMDVLRKKFNERIDSEFSTISEYFSALVESIEHAAETETRKLHDEAASPSFPAERTPD